MSLKINWNQIFISLIIGLALGTAFGQWRSRENFHHRWKKGPEAMRQHMVEKFSKELHLNSEQKKQVAAIFEAKHPQMVELQKEMKPKLDALRNSTQAEVRKILTPEQEKKLDALNAKMDERWQKRFATTS